MFLPTASSAGKINLDIPQAVSIALGVPRAGGDPGKTANPAALLALRRAQAAQAAQVIGDKPGALEALGAFEPSRSP